VYFSDSSDILARNPVTTSSGGSPFSLTPISTIWISGNLKFLLILSFLELNKSVGLIIEKFSIINFFLKLELSFFSKAVFLG